MGIDARMLVRHSGAPLDETQVRRLAGRMAALFGTGLFSIRTESDEDWPAHHALSIGWTVARARAWYERGGDPEPALDGQPDTAPFFMQDGPPLVGAPGEQFIEVHLRQRWFGIGYPRGYWPTTRAVAEFLERHIPGGAVWYGGDSCGVLMEPLDAAARERLTAYFVDGGEADYDLTGSKPCVVCGGRPMARVSDPDDPVAIFHCDGCDRREVDYGVSGEAAGTTASGFDPAPGRRTSDPEGRPSGEGSLERPAGAFAWWDRLLGRPVPVRGGPGRGRLTGRRRVYRPPVGEGG